MSHEPTSTPGQPGSSSPTRTAASEPIPIAFETEMPKGELLANVKYTYTSVAQIMSTIQDVRIAFGDRIPPDGRVEPLFGITLSHDHARRFAEALTTNLQRHKKIMLQVGQSGEPIKLPASLSGAEAYEILKSQEGIPRLKLRLKDGGERIIEGDQITEEIKVFMSALESKKLAP